MDAPPAFFLINPAHRAVAEGKARLLPLFSGAGVLNAIRLARRGRVLPGEVIFCSGTRTEDGSLVVNMKFRFTTTDGRALESVQRFGGARLPGEMLPAPRTPLLVYYASDDCYAVL